MDVRPLGEAWGHLSHVPLRAEASDTSECVNEVLAGETVTELELGRGDWVRVRLPDGYEGWMDRRQLHPVSTMWLGTPLRLAKASSAWKGVAGGWLPAGASVRCHDGRWWLGEWEVTPLGEVPVVHEGSMCAWAQTMMGVPYHWGGRSGWGLDCSGMTSLAAALVGIHVPRDASQQVEVGTEVTPGEEREDDVAFFQNPEGRITHVGLCTGRGTVIHASGEVREDHLSQYKLARHEDGKVSHHLACIRRWR